MSERTRREAKTTEAKKENPVAKQRKTELYQPLKSPPDQILFLQRTIGNQAVGRLIKSGALQAKLKTGQPGDKYEQEADRVAEQVMRMPEPQVSNETKVSNPARNTSIQRKCPGCNKGIKIEKEEEEEKLQKKEASGSTHEVTPKLESSISAVSGGGQPLPESARAFYEPRYGVDFSQVRVHSDSMAAETSRAINARAFTLGKNIVFGAGEYSPKTSSGKRLLAHELAHVMQQSGNMIHEIRRQIMIPPDPLKEARCKDLLALIKEAVAVLISRATDLINDTLGLQWENWTTPKIVPDGRGGTINYGSVQGHQQQYEGWRNRLKNLIDRWNNDDCNSTGLRVPVEVREWAYKPIPEPIPHPRPETGPRPWEAPAARRVGAAAKGAAIGATAGLILGGIIGAIGGGAGGTLVAPGVGTVGVGVAGAIAGAEAGAVVGAPVGAAIGGLIGWFTDE